MKIVAFLCFFLAASSGFAKNIESVDDAWAYLTDSGLKHQWVVIALANGRYMQCANMGDYISCPFPVWIQKMPGVKQVKLVKTQQSPFPAPPGSETKEYLSGSDVAKLKNIAASAKLETADVYHQLADANGKLVGTAADFVMVLEMDYQNFNRLVDAVFSKAWPKSATEKYNFVTD